MDPITHQLFSLFMKAAETKTSLDTAIRDALLKNLHFKYKYEIQSLAQMFKIGKRRVKEIIKSLGKSSKG